jgi:NTP pyrophosphatase (non-canonical NTP hydrolase)
MMDDYAVLESKVLDWAESKGILAKSDPKTQCLKCVSEVGELADAVRELNRRTQAVGDMDETNDALGDVLVTLIILADLLKTDLTDCLSEAYEIIRKREGRMVNGIFVKDTV